MQSAWRPHSLAHIGRHHPCLPHPQRRQQRSPLLPSPSSAESPSSLPMKTLRLDMTATEDALELHVQFGLVCHVEIACLASVFVDSNGARLAALIDVHDLIRANEQHTTNRQCQWQSLRSSSRAQDGSCEEERMPNVGSRYSCRNAKSTGCVRAGSSMRSFSALSLAGLPCRCLDHFPPPQPPRRQPA
ncbi:hypothetical protein KC323_g210 [Hortaea werneckii]|nr:hypothetical protein KC323_g210 [Hortaea werneckii]